MYDRRTLLVLGGAAVASVVHADNPFVAEDDNPFVAPEKPKHGIIEFLTGPNCVWCDKWRSDVMPECKKSGWKIEEYEVSGPIPRFHVWIKGKKHSHSGYMSTADLWRMMGLEPPKPPKPKKLAPPNITGYRPRWTYPGSLEQHLRGPMHSMDPTGWTRDQMEYAHDTHHDMMRRGGRSVRPSWASSGKIRACPPGLA